MGFYIVACNYNIDYKRMWRIRFGYPVDFYTLNVLWKYLLQVKFIRTKLCLLSYLHVYKSMTTKNWSERCVKSITWYQVSFKTQQFAMLHRTSDDKKWSCKWWTSFNRFSQHFPWVRPLHTVDIFSTLERERGNYRQPQKHALGTGTIREVKRCNINSEI